MVIKNNFCDRRYHSLLSPKTIYTTYEVKEKLFMAVSHVICFKGHYCMKSRSAIYRSVEVQTTTPRLSSFVK